MEELIVSSVKLMEMSSGENAEANCQNLEGDSQDTGGEEDNPENIPEKNDPENVPEENYPDEISEENDSDKIPEEIDPDEISEENIPVKIPEENSSEIGDEESSVMVAEEKNLEPVSNQIVKENCTPAEKANFIKFRQIMNEHLNGETVDAPDSVTQSVLTSYTLAGYLDHAIPLRKEVIVMKLHRDCCTTLLDLLR